jgi:nucleotide-binding universal stress UspA family protein
MARWRKICCAVDFHEPSWRAMTAAAVMARRFEAELTLVHVLVPPPLWTSDEAAPAVAWGEAEEGERLLRRWVADASRRSGRVVRARILSGDPAAELASYAREVACDLLVVGVRGPADRRHVLMGTLAGRLSRRCPCPVFVVSGGGGPEEDRPTGPWQ